MLLFLGFMLNGYLSCCYGWVEIFNDCSVRFVAVFVHIFNSHDGYAHKLRKKEISFPSAGFSCSSCIFLFILPGFQDGSLYKHFKVLRNNNQRQKEKKKNKEQGDGLSSGSVHPLLYRLEL